MTAPEIAYVVPTKDRPEDLKKLLESLKAQSVRPKQIIIVDGSDPDISYIVGRFPELPITYVREFPPSLARQRNAGMAALDDEVTIAGYLDDDIELASDATQMMQVFWANADASVGGASFTIVNQPRRHSLLSLVSSFFLINSNAQGKVLSSGFATSITPIEHDQQTHWLYGGATLWRREVISKQAYDEWYIGHGYLEDLDFSYCVGQENSLWVVAGARLWHYPSEVVGKRNIVLGRQQVVNRIYFTKKVGHFSGTKVWWGLFGQCIRNVLESAGKLNLDGLYRFWGNLLGLRDLLKNGTKSVDGIWK